MHLLQCVQCSCDVPLNYNLNGCSMQEQQKRQNMNQKNILKAHTATTKSRLHKFPEHVQQNVNSSDPFLSKCATHDGHGPWHNILLQLPTFFCIFCATCQAPQETRLDWTRLSIVFCSRRTVAWCQTMNDKFGQGLLQFMLRFCDERIVLLFHTAVCVRKTKSQGKSHRNQNTELNHKTKHRRSLPMSLSAKSPVD